MISPAILKPDFAHFCLQFQYSNI